MVITVFPLVNVDLAKVSRGVGLGWPRRPTKTVITRLRRFNNRSTLSLHWPNRLTVTCEKAKACRARAG